MGRGAWGVGRGAWGVGGGDGVTVWAKIFARLFRVPANSVSRLVFLPKPAAQRRIGQSLFGASHARKRAPFLEGRKADKAIVAEMQQALVKPEPVRRQIVSYARNSSTITLVSRSSWA